MKDKILQRFLKYISFNTQSQFDKEQYPSTCGQIEFAKYLCDELISIGIKDAYIDTHNYVIGTLPSNTNKKLPILGLIAHIDTSPDTSGENVNAQTIHNYDGTDILLNKEKNIVLKAKEYPELTKYRGQTIICSDGTTLLGADDKAGIAEIMTAIEYLIEYSEIEHGEVKIAFTSDEEIGRGVDFFDVDKFGADFAFTIDGGELGELEYENFNAAIAQINISGKNIHPGYAKNKMVNAIQLFNELHNLLPINERPETTDNYEGFYHPINISGDVNQINVKYLIREHNIEEFENKKNYLKEIISKINHTYNNSYICIEITDQYFNMLPKIQPVSYIVDYAVEAMKLSNVTPKIVPIRGGTDGARLSYMGLPCPNIFTGGHNFHSIYEYIPLESMEKATNVIINLIKIINLK